ncbi:expressed unknown protein [Seminavis robusta]|uniref:LNR domain-containing protein n=1 Tax=Seminavis robusta TaxID=568900 RepID=A0A9N8HNL9_9STRA|nr:expressed unknown protein [Seminavis robusta]|eukprot:Sro1228_g254420.1 n/a (891) ;mRNA; r:26635-29564
MKIGMMSLLSTCISLSLVALAASTESPSKTAFVKRMLQADDLSRRVESASRSLVEEEEDWDLHPGFRRRHVGLVHPDHAHDHSGRQTQSDFTKEQNCDQALLSCLPEEKCASCFRYLYGENVDWGTVTPDTSCDDVLGFLAKKSHCSDMHSDNGAREAFCKAFNACAVWEEDDKDEEDGDDDDEEDLIDCDSLIDCNWPGIRKNWLMDGICHDQMGGCYNTAICGWDGGDCCEDTCTSGTYAECGHDGYFCRDTNSTKCDPKFSLACTNTNMTDENNPDPALTQCGDDEVKYKLTMYDTFGDGWDATTLNITAAAHTDSVKFSGALNSGSKGIRYICLPKESTCLHVDVAGGEWGNEASWEVRPMANGAPALAAGGAPMNCDFSVGGKACKDNTCDGKPNVKPNNDPEYKEFKEMYTCIEKQCTIQVGICEKDETCNLCLAEEKADFCYGSDAFLAVVDCTMCHCTARKDSDFCQTKLNPGILPSATTIENNNNDGRQPDGSTRTCSPGETMKGSDAVLTFAECTDMDQITLLVRDYDMNKFGLLDQFEACAHGYKSAANHGGHTALGCMGILERATHMAEEQSEEEYADAISALATLLYHQADSFCECASKASADCPLCSSFIHLKSLLYESMDGCKSLDEIDCDAWAEFYTPCKESLEDKFDGTIDFSKSEVCQFVQDGCGKSGAFPVLRRIDCEAEISSAAWGFYQDYAKNCLEATAAPAAVPADKDTPAPVAPLTPRPTAPTGPKPEPTPRPTMKPYVPTDSSSANKKPYVVPSDSSSSTSTANKKPYYPSDYVPAEDSDSSGKKSHFFRNFFIVLVLGGAGFVYYKKRTEAFSFVRYRNSRNYAGGESEMYSAPYSGLTMDSASGAFQPPSLPPTPSAIDGGGMY